MASPGLSRSRFQPWTRSGPLWPESMAATIPRPIRLQPADPSRARLTRASGRMFRDHSSGCHFLIALSMPGGPAEGDPGRSC
jgi:hypothetical protein